MLSAAKVTEIYCMTDDFAGNLCCTGKNIWLGIKYCNMYGAQNETYIED